MNVYVQLFYVDVITYPLIKFRIIQAGETVSWVNDVVHILHRSIVQPDRPFTQKIG